jgi:acyl-CoA thioesterase-1
MLALAAAALPGEVLAQVSVVVLGDSNVAGTGVSAGQRYPAQLEAALRARGLDVRVANAGINGDTVGGAAARLDSAVPAGTRVVVLWIGINDRRAGATQETVRGNVGALAARIRQRGALVHVIRPPDLQGIRAAANVTLGSDGHIWRGMPDPHLNGRGYALVVQRTAGPIGALVRQAARRRG